MSKSTIKKLTPAAWLFYVVIVFEILFMISPAALYYYATYGPSLNFLHRSPATAWLTGFILPHYSISSSPILNHISALGSGLFLLGLALFLSGALQIYAAKFQRKGNVVGGLYKYMRHPQYTALAIMGLGTLLIWPRFTVLIMYIAMLFAYNWLASKEEQDCLERYGESYQAYMARTPRFLPWRLPIPSVRLSAPVRALLFVAVLAGALTLAVAVRNYAVTTIATLQHDQGVTVAPSELSEAEIRAVVTIAASDSMVNQTLRSAGYGTETFLNYILPVDWFLSDLPMDPPEGIGEHGHVQPSIFDREKYKVLFTRAQTYAPSRGLNILKTAYARQPVLVVKVNRATGRVLMVEEPPAHVRWGDIPTPLF